MDTSIRSMIDNQELATPGITAKETQDFQGLTMDEDVSLLRQPMRTALTGFLEAKKAYENGTDEVRRLLLHECSLIYECNVCRNMFRSLANFISHKRIYCKLPSEANFRSYSDHNSSLIIQTTEQSPQLWMNKSRSTGSSPIPTKSSTRDLSKIIERLKRVDVSNEQIPKLQPPQQPKQTNQIPADDEPSQHINQEESQRASYQTSPQQQTQSPLVGPDPVLQLESVPTSTQAVYQTLNPSHAADSIKTEVNEVHNLLINQQNTMIGPDGKAITPNQDFLSHPDCETPTLTALLREIKKPLIPSGDALQQTVQLIACEMCQMTFQTEKTLNIHIQKKHTSSTYVFQCPTCSLTFLQPAAVIRHLANEHKKPLKRIRKMRDTIFKKRVQIGDVQVKGPSRELKRLQLDSTKDIENAHGGDAVRQQEATAKPLSTCSHCQRTFEKRATFVTHLANCSSKNKSPIKDPGSSVKEEVQSKIRVATKAEIQTKLKNQNINLTKTLIENQNTSKYVKPTSVSHIDTMAMDNQMPIATRALANQGNETEIKNYDFDYLSHSLNKVNIKQEPQEEEFNSTSTQATTGSDINEMFENLEKQTFGKGLQIVSLDLMVATEKKEEGDDKSHSSIKQKDEDEEEEDQHIKENLIDKAISDLKSVQVIPEDPLEQPLKPLTENVGQKKKQKGFRVVPASKQLTCRCKICNKQFNALSNLRRHISMFHYRARRFGCNLCEYRAFRRYDIVNHLTFVHKMKGERESMAIEFVTMHEIPYSKDDVEHDIVVVQEAGENLKIQENGVKTYENKTKRKNRDDSDDNDESLTTLGQTTLPETSLPKVVRKRLRKALAHQQDHSGSSGQKRPIRNRIKPVNNDFVYDLSTFNEEPKDALTRLTLKRRNTMGMDNNNKYSTSSAELTPPIKITPYRLRTEPLIPANKETVKGTAARTYRNAVHEALAAPSTVPELPTERPQMRPRLSLACRNDSAAAPVIEATELEVARLESTFFDDSFLEKFAKTSNPSFKMKPLLASQHSPLNSILQKFENNSIKSLGSGTDESITKMQENGIGNATENNVTTLNSPPPLLFQTQQNAYLDYTQQDPLQSLSAEILDQMDASPPDGNHIMESSSPPSTPRKRITLMQRLAENRAKRRDTLIRSALEE